MAKRPRRPVDILVGSRIKQARHAAKVSQTELGEALGVTFQQVQKYEKGSNRVSAGALQIIAERLKVPVPWLMGLKADGHSAKGADGKIEMVMGTRDGYAIVETVARMDKKTRGRRARDRRADRQTGLVAPASHLAYGCAASRCRR